MRTKKEWWDEKVVGREKKKRGRKVGGGREIGE